MSLIEKQAKFHKPIYSELLKLINTVSRQEEQPTLRDGSGVAPTDGEADMRHILGFLNQSEWI